MVRYTRRTLPVLLGCFVLTRMAVAQNDSPGSSAPAAVVPSTEAPATPEDKRIFGVLPNYRTAEASLPFVPLTAKQKFRIAFKDSFDWPVYPTAAFPPDLAGVYVNAFPGPRARSTELAQADPRSPFSRPPPDQRPHRSG